VTRRLAAHGLSAEVGGGWEGEIYLRSAEAVPTAPARPSAGSTSGPTGLQPGSSVPVAATYPVLQLANFSLPSQRGDFGGGAVELMGAHNIFVSLFEYGHESVGTALFASQELPWPVAPDAFGPNRLQRPLPGQGGSQWFFTHRDRPFCLYVVLGSYLLRRATVRPLNRILHTISIT
jgi:hypothetical protein